MSSAYRTATLLLTIALLTGAQGSAQQDLPTPFSAEEIRDSFRKGLQVITRDWTPDGESHTRLTVTAWSESEVTLTNQPVDASGLTFGEKSVAVVSWGDLRDHASFPEDSATRERHTGGTSLGHLEGWLYRVNSEDGTQATFFFADEYPGPPVLYQSVRGDELLYRAEQIRRVYIE